MAFPSQVCLAAAPNVLQNAVSQNLDTVQVESYSPPCVLWRYVQKLLQKQEALEVQVCWIKSSRWFVFPQEYGQYESKAEFCLCGDEQFPRTGHSQKRCITLELVWLGIPYVIRSVLSISGRLTGFCFSIRSKHTLLLWWNLTSLCL